MTCASSSACPTPATLPCPKMPKHPGIRRCSCAVPFAVLVGQEPHDRLGDGETDGAHAPRPPKWISGSGVGAPCFEEVEVAALVGLRDVLQVQRAVAAAVLRRGRLPVGPALLQLLVGDVQRRAAARGHVELDHVAVADERERAADVRLRRHVQHAGAVAGAAHARVGDAHHVAHALLEQLLRDRQLAPLGHARRALRARALQHQHRVLVDHEIGVVDAGGHVVVVRRTPPRGPVCRCSRGSAAGGLITAPSGARLPCSTASVSDSTSGLSRVRMTSSSNTFGVGDVLAQRARRWP